KEQEAFEEVYCRRILRGAESFSRRKLGAFGAELAALAALFERPWDRPSARLTEADRAWLLNTAGFHLRALGRLPEAVQPMQAALDARIAQENWEGAAISAGNLSELSLTLGDVVGAIETGEESVEVANRSGDAFKRLAKGSGLAYALLHAGRWEECEALFREAEAIQAEPVERVPPPLLTPRLLVLRPPPRPGGAGGRLGVERCGGGVSEGVQGGAGAG
ncbi:MAG TPA: tetratricopeptide repeat protein, partial [Thermoanaerobaculia bacterium]|nr:tetratricopeptide repeat protein [Thermoanaerobaculia bacterium]